MNKNELIKQCRYYKGEVKNPFEGKEQNKAMLWFYEKIWTNSNTTDAVMDEYRMYLHRDLPELTTNDYVPTSLISLIYDRYTHFGGDAEGFKKLFEAYYMK